LEQQFLVGYASALVTDAVEAITMARKEKWFCEI
jgi:hypothetical protein